MQLSDAYFKQIIGVTKETFDTMAEILHEAYAAKHTRRGRHAKLSIEEELFLSLKYLRQYVPQKELAFEFEVSEATVHTVITWVEDTLAMSGKFSLPGKKHDFKLYQESTGSTVSEDIKIQGDSGYQGILALHKNSETPQKKSRGKELTDDKKMRTSVFSVSEFSLRILTLRLRCSKLRQINTVIVVNDLDCVWH